MTTVRELVNQLMKCKYLDEPVLYEYYLREHFENTGVSSEAWAKIASENDEILVNEDNFSFLHEAIKATK